MSSSTDNPWAYYGLPPFFTEQPAPGTLERQMGLWHALLLDHAVYYSSRVTSSSSVCPLVRHYDESSEVFGNAEIKRRLPPRSARTLLKNFAAQRPNEAVLTRKDNGEVGVLVAVNHGGLKGLEQGLLNWVLEMGEGTTTAMLSKKGVVLTFDEMAEQKALQYGRNPKTSALIERVCNTSPLPCKDTGAVSEEQAVRLLLGAQKYRAAGSPLQPFAVTLFNLDGSDDEPFQGVKLGGSK